jgi:hypothetical protein
MTIDLVVFMRRIFLEYALELTPGAMIHIPSFMTVLSGNRVISRALPQQFGRP